HYQLVSELGRGGMGVVYKALDTELDRHVAIKVLAEGLAHDARIVERFQREARAVAALDDPNVVHIYATGTQGGRPYFAMEFVDGVALDVLLQREERLAPEQAARLIVQAAHGVASAHAKGLIHRDIKPANILVSRRGIAKVSDFGIAQSVQARDARLTDTGAFLGTPGYLAPERYAGAAADARADIFALGVVLFECLAGHRPFGGDSPLAVMRDVADKPLPDIHALNPGVDAELARILGRMTAKEPAQRYPDCEALIADLDRHFSIGADVALRVAVWQAPELPLTRKLGGVSTLNWTQPFHNAPRNRRAAFWALAGLAAALAIGGWLWRVTHAPRATTPAVIAPSQITEKSIAVLPFENLSADTGNIYFAAGIQDLIVTKLAGIAELKVISRASTEKYGARPDDVKAIGQQLGVASVLEGSVQRLGDEVLINVQLIDTRSDAHVWAQDYPRRLDNLFGVEGEVAQKVADALKARLSPAETASLTAVPTENQAALDAFLHAEYQAGRGKTDNDTASLKAALPLYRQAVTQDPRFALAFARVSYVESELAWLNGGGGLDVKQLTVQARADAEQAMQIAPNLAEAHLAIGYSDYYGRGDYAAARQAFDRALALRPNDADALAARGYVERREGRFDAAIASLQGALTHDPRNSALANDLGETCMMASRYGEAATWLQRSLALDPANLSARIDISNTLLLQSGDVQAALDAAQGDEPVLRLWRTDLLVYQRKHAQAIALLNGVPDNADNFSFVRGSKALQLANLYRLAGDAVRAQPLYGQALAAAKGELQSQQGGDLASVWSNVAAAELGLGNVSQGLDAVARSQAIVTATDDKVAGAGVMQNNAAHYAQAQRADLAVPLLQTALASSGIGFYYSPAMLAVDPAWDPIRKDPRFQALLKTYAGAPASDGRKAAKTDAIQSP
ncbi:MAG: protein kinase, partial [Proteobacteria bacterium]|nr:protein kinase [Pseudomonadota bacterium]